MRINRLLLLFGVSACLAACSSTDSNPDDQQVGGCGNAAVWRAMASSVDVTLDAVWGISPDDVWAAGDNGVILHFDGSAWTPESNGIAGGFDRFTGIAADDVYVAGQELEPDAGGTKTRIYHYDGKSWTRSDPTFAGRIYGIHMTGPDSVWAVGDYVNRGRIWHFDGQTWAERQTDVDQYQDVFGVSDDNLYFVADNGDRNEIMRFDGNAFETVFGLEEISLNRIIGFNTGELLAVGEDVDGEALVVNRGDSRFSETALPFNGELNDIWGNDPETLFSVGDSGLIVQFNGSDWSRMESNTNHRLNGVYGFGADDVFAVGDNGTILHYSCEAPEVDTDTEPEHCDWMRLFKAEGTEFYGLWGVSSAEMYIAATIGVLRVSNETTFSELWTRANMTLEAIWGDESGRFFAVGYDSNKDGAMIVSCTREGCAEMENDLPGELEQIIGFSENDIYVVGHTSLDGRRDGVIGYYNGESWSRDTSFQSDSFLTGIFGTAPDDLYVAGWTYEGTGEVEYGRIWYFDGTSWQMVLDECPTRLLDIWGTGGQNLYAVGADEFAPLLGREPAGVVMRYDGSGWQELFTSSTEIFHAIFGLSEDGVFISQRTWQEVSETYETQVQLLDGEETRILSVELTPPSSPDEPIDDFWADSDGNVFAITNGGTFLKYVPEE